MKNLCLVLLLPLVLCVGCQTRYKVIFESKEPADVYCNGNYVGKTPCDWYILHDDHDPAWIAVKNKEDVAPLNCYAVWPTGERLPINEVDIFSKWGTEWGTRLPLDKPVAEKPKAPAKKKAPSKKKTTKKSTKKKSK